MKASESRGLGSGAWVPCALLPGTAEGSAAGRASAAGAGAGRSESAMGAEAALAGFAGMAVPGQPNEAANRGNAPHGGIIRRFAMP